jgi:DNA-binding response OmpR family regulator
LLRRSKTDDDGAPIPADGAHVLIVHDDPDAGRTLGRLFESRNFAVTRADTLDAALDAVVSDPGVDLVLIDLRIGGTSQALKLLDEIRAQPEPHIAHTRVVLTTDIDENRMFSWQSGIDGFLIRPFHADDLLAVVVDTLGRDEAARASHRQAQMQVSADPQRRAAGDDR